MEYSIVNKIHINRKHCKRIGAFLYDPEIDGLYHESPWPFPVQIGITDGLSKCEVTPMFIQLPFIMKGWINHDILLRQIDLLKLVMTGKILMHGSCVDNTLIVGLPNSGKTYETYKRVAAGGKLISEEYTVIDGEYASPYKEYMRTCFSAKTLEVAKLKTSFREKLWLGAATLRATLFPFMYESVIWKKIKASGEKSEIKEILYGSTGNQVTDWRVFTILCENEFPYLSSEFLQAYALASGFDLLFVQHTQRNLIKDFMRKVYPNEDIDYRE